MIIEKELLLHSNLFSNADFDHCGWKHRPSETHALCVQSKKIVVKDYGNLIIAKTTQYLYNLFWVYTSFS